MDDGCTDSEEPRLDKVDVVEMDDSLDGDERTSISSAIERFRFRDGGAVIVVFIFASAAALAFRLVVVGDGGILFRLVLSLEEEAAVERVCRKGGDRSGVI